MKKIFSVTCLLSLALVQTFFSSCVKNEFDAPATANVDPEIGVTKSILQLQAMAAGTIPVLITTNEVIEGVVIADDASGNFYKEVILQDSTGGIAVQLDQSNFNTLYPIGRRIFVKCKGLYIADDGNGNIQIGIKDLGAIGRIPSGLVPQYLLKGKWGIPVTPKTVTIATIGNEPTQTLIKLLNVEFTAADSAQLYANATTLQSQNRFIEDCGGAQADIYSSGYADFAGLLTPTGKGSLVSVYKIYNGAPELELRNVEDVSMTGARCGGGTGLTVGTGALMTVGAIRGAYTGSAAIFAAGTKVRGTVISDVSTANINSYNVILQDGASGLIVRFAAVNTFNLNDSLEIDLSGDSLQTYQAGIEINYVANASATLLGTGTVAANVQTAAYVLANLNTLESTLVKITGATLSGGTTGTYSGSANITDATGAVILYTRSAATFATTAYPTGTVSVQGFLSNYNGTPELILRNASDVQ